MTSIQAASGLNDDNEDSRTSAGLEFAGPRLRASSIPGQLGPLRMYLHAPGPHLPHL